MSVARQLGLGDPGEGLLRAARSEWPSWRARHPGLDPVPDLPALPGWLRTAAADQADAVLLALAELAAPDGGDNLAAAGALAWVLLPGASLVAHRLRTLSPRIDELVAAQLWVEARSFPWRRGRKVAANIVMNTRKGVLRDLGVGEHAERAWRQRVPLSPGSLVWREVEIRSSGQTAAQKLAEVLVWACGRGAITPSDRALLLHLADAADRAPTTRLGRQSGLMTADASGAVAARWGISAVTVRRRARRAVGAVAAASSEARASNRIAG